MVRRIRESYINHRVENIDDLVQRVEEIALEEYGMYYDIEVVETDNDKWEILADGKPMGYFTLKTLNDAIKKAKEAAQSSPKTLFGRNLTSTQISLVEAQCYEDELESQLQRIVRIILRYIP